MAAAERVETTTAAAAMMIIIRDEHTSRVKVLSV